MRRLRPVGEGDERAGSRSFRNHHSAAPSERRVPRSPSGERSESEGSCWLRVEVDCSHASRHAWRARPGGLWPPEGRVRSRFETTIPPLRRSGGCHDPRVVSEANPRGRAGCAWESVIPTRADTRREHDPALRDFVTPLRDRGTRRPLAAGGDARAMSVSPKAAKARTRPRSGRQRAKSWPPQNDQRRPLFGAPLAPFFPLSASRRSSVPCKPNLTVRPLLRSLTRRRPSS